MSAFARFADSLYHNRSLARLFHTTPYCLARALRGCDSVLDLGCGANSPVAQIRLPRSIGVELFEPALARATQRQTHTELINADARSFEFPAKSVDAVVLLEILEHMTKEDGYALLDRAESWARKRVVVSTPNGYVAQGSIGGNPHQVHHAGWTVDELRSRGYTAYGLAGLKYLRQEGDADTDQESSDAMLSDIRWKPRALWWCVSAASQLLTYYVPQLSFGVMYVRELVSPARESR